MANTYTQLFIQLVFSPIRKTALIRDSYEINLHKYITGIITNKGHKMICINGTEDHIHILISLNPEYSISSLVQEVKRSSSIWINDNKFCLGRFEWQSGFGAFSYSKSQLKNVIVYIGNQKEHHKKVSFLDEYKTFLNNLDVEYDPRYIFKELQND
jgi:REP element-mobilizing transposase RayT